MWPKPWLEEPKPSSIAVAAVLSALEGAGVAMPPSEPLERPPLKNQPLGTAAL